MSAGLAVCNQIAVDVDAVGVLGILETLADAFRAVALEQSYGIRIVSEEITVLTVRDGRQHLHHLCPRSQIIGSGSVIKGLDTADGHIHIAMQRGLGR